MLRDPLLRRYESYDRPGSIIFNSNANAYLREHGDRHFPHFAPTVKPASYDYTIGEEEDEADGFSFGGGGNGISEGGWGT